MNLNFFHSLTLKTRVTLFSLGIFLLSIWSLAFFASHMLREDMRRLVGEQQFSTASFMAAGVGDDLAERLRALEIIAAEFNQGNLAMPSTIQTRLEQLPVLHNLFNGGVAALDDQGTGVADVPAATGRIGVNFMDRDHVKVALREGKSSIGRPVVGKLLGAPVFGMAVPIRDSGGKVVGALLGVTDLSKVSFLDKIATNAYGKTGGYLLVSPRHRLIFASSDKRRVMEELPPPGVNPVIDRFIAGYEGSAVLVNPYGVEVLASAKSIPLAGWYVAAFLPTAEAFAPIRSMQRRMFLATIVLTLLAAGLTWAMLRSQLSPMLKAVKTLGALADAEQFPAPLAISRQDEIGALIGGFNHLLEVLGQREQAIKESEFRWKFAIEGAGDGLWDWNLADNTVFFTPRWKAMLGFADHEIGNGIEEWNKRVHPDDKARVLAAVDAYLKGRTPVYVSEHRLRARDGSYRWVLDRGMVVSRSEDGQPLRMIGTHSDITERKEMEALVHQLAFCDALTGLPNRRLLNDRLEQAMAAGKRSACHGALMLLDLDNFKPVNDGLGHSVGDLLLIQVAERLKGCVREMDTVARFGGDEFVVVLASLSPDRAEAEVEARKVAEKIRSALSEPYCLRPGEAATAIGHRCTASIGAVLFCGHAAASDQLLRWADGAMYQAKEAGRNGIHFWEPAGS